MVLLWAKTSDPHLVVVVVVVVFVVLVSRMKAPAVQILYRCSLARCIGTA